MARPTFCAAYSLSIYLWNFTTQRSRSGFPPFLFFLLLLITKLDIDFYLCGLSGFYFFSMCVRKPLKNATTAHKMSIPWLNHRSWFYDLIRLDWQIKIGRRKEEIDYFFLPFWRISRCSQRMSPMKGGVRARKFSLPMAHMSRPRMRKCCSTTPSSENSLMAQLSQRETSLSDHSRGSATTFTKWIQKISISKCKTPHTHTPRWRDTC